MKQKLFLFVHLIILLLCATLNTNVLFAQNKQKTTKATPKIDQSQLVTQQPRNGRLDIDTKTLKEGSNIVCQNKKTGQALVAIVKKGQIVGWETTQPTQNTKNNARNATSNAKTFKAKETKQYTIDPKSKTSRIATTNNLPSANARGAISCQTITCEQCFTTLSTCEKCKDCKPSGVAPPILTSEGSGVIIEEDLQFALTNWYNESISLDTYSYSYTPYVSIVAPQMFSQMGW